ncbi:hypothetical protein [Fictibacillus sp. S7]|uniref:hypothetical protein n=1 Tax=Fictibacillus sp. S7 TaxID=2212476 RepID=UPI001010E979|nr:hypothetical protein [Fictibacillus sp. S7]RXZ00836.1 hypothetical protein DMO16_14815 [Fictibacillus sp. S7]
MQVTKCIIEADFLNDDKVEIFILAEEKAVLYRFHYNKDHGRAKTPTYTGKLAKIINDKAVNCDNPPFDHHQVAKDLLNDRKVRLRVLFDTKESDLHDPDKASFKI